MNIKRFAVRVAVCAAVCGCAFPFGESARAQSATPSPQELNPGLRLPSVPTESSNKGDLLSAPEGGPCPLRSSTLTFTLTKVTFAGADNIPLEIFGPAYADLIGRQIPVSAICDIRDKAASILFRRGILARVEIPEQRIAQGTLKLDVIEAYVASVSVVGDVGPAGGTVAQYVEQLRGMKPFNINKAQRYLFLASDIPGVRISATLKPSPQGRGAVALEIAVAREAFHALLNFQNSGSNATGPWGALARVDFNSFTSLGERTSVIGYTTYQPDEQKVLQVIEDVKLGSEGLAGHVSISWGITHPGSDLKVLGLRGDSLVADVAVSYPIVRARRANLNLSGGIEFIEQSVDVAGTVPLTRDSLRVFHLNASGDYTFTGEIPIATNLDLELRQGVTFLGASDKGSALASRIDGHPDATVLRANGGVTVGWLPYLSTSASFAAQYASDPLLAYEEMYAGNLTIGRGYDPSVVSGDRGIAGSFEGHLGPFDFGIAQATLLAFYDISYLDNLDTGGIHRTLQSVGAGVGFQISNLAHLDVTYAHPLDKVSETAARRPPDRVLLSLTLSY
jgi:hemolysin activation/secretion protein